MEALCRVQNSTRVDEHIEGLSIEIMGFSFHRVDVIRDNYMAYQMTDPIVNSALFGFEDIIRNIKHRQCQASI